MNSRYKIIIGIVALIVASYVLYNFIPSDKVLEDIEITQDYSELLRGADKNIDIAHHIDIIPINSTKHAFSIKSINLNSDDSITINFGGVNENFMTIPEFNYARTFQVNDSFVFYCMPTESGYPSMGIYKYLGTHVIDRNLSYAFYHGDASSLNEFECTYPEIIEQSVNIFDIQLSPEMLQNYGIGLD